MNIRSFEIENSTKPFAGLFILKKNKKPIIISNNHYLKEITKIHNNLDLFLDKVFISVIDKYPQLAPKIFSSLASKLSGDEMAQFMSGECSKLTIFKVIFAMPKLPFIKSFMLMLLSNARN